MSKFKSSLSGIANNKKLTDNDLIRAIRFVATGEYEAAQTYIQLAESIDNKLAAKVFKSVADIKRDQMGDFLRLPYEGTNLYAKGAKEREESNQDNAA